MIFIRKVYIRINLTFIENLKSIHLRTVVVKRKSLYKKANIFIIPHSI